MLSGTESPKGLSEEILSGQPSTKMQIAIQKPVVKTYVFSFHLRNGFQIFFLKKKLDSYFLKEALWVTSMYKKDKSGSALFEGGSRDRLSPTDLPLP